MRRLLFVALVVLTFPFAPIARSTQAATAAKPAKLVRVFVTLRGSPVAADLNLRTRASVFRSRLKFNPGLSAARTYGAALTRFQDQEIAYLLQQGIDLRVNYRYRIVFNGFSAFVAQGQLARLARLANVRAVTPVRRVVPQLDRSVGLVNGDKAWQTLGGQANAGKGIAIADIDTGIDMKNPCFRSVGLPPWKFGAQSASDPNARLTNDKVVRIRAFGSNANVQYSAVDTNGHGTFTASVEACDANTPTPLGVKISGLAPAAYLMAYNIQPDGDDGQGQQDPSLAAFEAAVQDGADVINYSYGSVFGAGDEREDPSVAALNTIVRAGIPVVVSAGNGGPTPQSVSSPSTSDQVISVGASTNSRAYTSTIQVSGTGVPATLQQIPARQGSRGFDRAIGPAQVVDVGLGRVPKDDPDNPTANDFAGKDVRGKIALIQRGITFFETKINNAEKAGAIGAIIYDNRTSLDPFGMDTRSATLPAMSIRQSDGVALLNQIKNQPDTTVTFQPVKQVLPTTPNVLSDFSARGYGPDYRIKPDLVAPGENIYAATQTGTPSGEMYDSSGFTMADGTSFSGPHVAGAVALLLQKRNFTPADVKAVLMESASTTALTDPASATASVMDTGAGLLDVQAALTARAEILPASVSLGQINVGYGAQTRQSSFALKDLGGGAGTWTVSVQQLHGSTGLSISSPASVQVAASGSATVGLTFSVASSVPAGNYDGYVVLRNGDRTLHIPYFLHVATESVAPGTVLLVDATNSRFQLTPTTPPAKSKDVSVYFKNALTALRRPYTYWNIGAQGSPSVTDMQRASAIIYFTGANLNGFGSDNGDFQSLFGPLSSIDMMNLRRYLEGGGRVFVTGPGAGLSDPYWTAMVMGANVASLSMYDNERNDQNAVGGVSPPRPSALVDRRGAILKNPWFFSGMKPIDFSTKGDGAGTNIAVNSKATPTIFGESLVGVTALQPFNGMVTGLGAAFGRAILRTASLSTAVGGGDVATASSDEPTFTHKPKYKGRSVFFSFDFAGINNNTGYSTREQVLRRVLAWLDDSPTARVVQTRFSARRAVQLKAAVRSAAGSHIVKVAWQVGSRTLRASHGPTSYRFPRPGTYRLRALVTDAVGHNALTPWTTVKVR